MSSILLGKYQSIFWSVKFFSTNQSSAVPQLIAMVDFFQKHLLGQWKTRYASQNVYKLL